MPRGAWKKKHLFWGLEGDAGKNRNALEDVKNLRSNEVIGYDA